MDKLSIVTAPVELLDGEGKYITRASGFFYKTVNDKVYFVTNWHVVVGRDPTRARFSRHGSAEPQILRLKLHKRLIVEGISLDAEQKTHWDIQLYQGDGVTPAWFEHPAHGCKVDVVALELEAERLRAAARFFTIEDCNLIQTYSEHVMDDIFIIGHPFGLTGGDGVLPLYKHGSIASEPSIPLHKLPRFLVDCRTDKGMSGSPAICNRFGIGPTRKFLGVYSGRPKEKAEPGTHGSDDRTTSDIGFIWTQAALEEIVSARKNGVPIADLTD